VARRTSRTTEPTAHLSAADPSADDLSADGRSSEDLSADMSAATAAVLGPGVRLRQEQARALAALERTDTLLVARSGVGKTAVYDIASRVRPGLAVVVSPTLSLQRDQVATLGTTGRRASLLNSTLGAAEERRVLQAVADGSTEVLLLAPEQLGRDAVVEALSRATVGLVVVDEAHCVSEWGHDFRPDYLQVGTAVLRLGRPRVLAMTATASHQVREDVLSRLGLEAAEVVVGDVDRPNIHLAARDVPDARRAEEAVLEAVAAAPGRRSSTPRPAPQSSTSPRRCAGRGSPPRATTPACPHAGGSRCRTTSSRVAATSWSRRPPSGWASTAPTCGSSCTPARRRRWTRTTRRSAAPGATGSPPPRCSVHRAEDFALGRYLRSGGGPRPDTLRAVLHGPAPRGPQHPP
jgi:ATP-dependent DNA helicase RecQ